MQSMITRRRAFGVGALLFGSPAGTAWANGDAVCPELIGKVCRVIRPGDMVTQDYSPDRVNIVLDEDSRIVEIKYG